MARTDILDQNYRKQVIDDIEGDENLKRKEESLKRYEIYNDRLEEHVYYILRKQLEAETVDSMRVISSINLTKRIIDEQSSIYNRKPKREFDDLSDDEKERAELIYQKGRFNTGFKKANKWFNLMDQCTIQILPKAGRFKMKVLAPHHFDVIPNPLDPERADVYILSQYDKERMFSKTTNSNNVTPQPSAIEYRDRTNVNTAIGDQGDWQGREGIYVWWSDDFHFITDKDGSILDPETMKPMPGGTDLDIIKNPIGTLPFADVVDERDGEYWQRFGNSTTDFTLDFALILSDTSEVNRLQGYSQAVISSVEQPKNLKIGPNSAIWLKNDPNGESSAQPKFAFESPNPDLSASIDLLSTYLSMFLTSKGLDPGTISGAGTSERFTSGMDRLLANIEKFEASQDDFDLFKDVEEKTYSIVKAWLEAFQGVTDGGLDKQMAGRFPETSEMSIKYEKPQTDVSQQQKEESLARRMDMGLISRAEALAELKEIPVELAEEMIEEIDEEIVVGDPEPKAIGE